MLEVSELHVEFPTPTGIVRAVNGASFEVASGETLGIVGESGSGKSVTALAVLGLVAAPGKVTSSGMSLAGERLDLMPRDELRRIRGDRIAMIFQEPMTSLNPVFTIGYQIAEVVKLHRGLSGRQALRFAVDMLEKVGIATPARRIHDYPHQLSGGMRQRVMIAMALACNPKVLLADEPTTALDVTIQAQIVDLLQKLQREFGTAIVLISHDMGLVAETCHRVAVMYAGRVVEQGPVAQIFNAPLHPYTQALLRSIPRLRKKREDEKVRRLAAIPGSVPHPAHTPAGCAFTARCTRAVAQCATGVPALVQVQPSRTVRCWLHPAP
jgi:peptide/nickel transport system ATP-binding protein